MRHPRQLRVLLLYDCIYPDAAGGVEHRNFELALELGRRGHQVTLAGFAARSSTPAPGVEVRSLGPPARLYDPTGRRSRTQALRLAMAAARLDLRPFDLVETANIPYLHLAPLALRCRLAGKPLVVNWHAHWGRYWREYIGGPSWPLYAAIEWLAAQAGTAAFAVSRMTAGRVAAQRRGGAVEVVPNGVPAGRIRGAARAGDPPGPPLLFAGRLIRERRLHLLVEALAILSAAAGPSSGGALLAIAGEGPERQRLEELARHRGVADRIVFHGTLPSASLWREMARSRIAVQPSSQESFGMFPLEAMAAGLPVLYCTSPDSALGELVRDGVDGHAVAPSAEAIARRAGELLRDGAAWDRLHANALARAAAYDWAAVAERVEDLYLALAGRSSAKLV
ncbi:MAG TPA: glycosyltransferase family 4 protein [Thermoanaerobaculia bacterium]|nr:glycosyltransferase family 4 protein [Thermoanaerobaculia bacterium]